ncbi:MAG: UbiD family decarboxylase [Chlamydiales bacterium]
MPSHLNLRDFLQELRKSEEIVDVYHPVDPDLELAEIHRRVAAVNGPALFFHHVKNSSFPVVTNLFGSLKRVKLAFPNHPEQVIAQLVQMISKNFPPKWNLLWKNRQLLKNCLYLGTKKSKHGPIKAVHCHPPNLNKIPMLKTWPMDGGHFITLPLVYTESPEARIPNLGMYRIQRYNATEAGLHFQIQKGGGFHFYQAEKENQPLPVSIFIGGPPALMLSAIAPLPENISETMICGLIQGKKLDVCHSPYTSHPLISECEFALIGNAQPHIRRLEGPFGDHYGYYSLKHPFPVFTCDAIYHRKDAIYPATIVGKPRQEDFYIGNYLQELLSPLFPLVMPGVKALWSYGETGFHSLSAAVVQERYYRESMVSAFRILGEGQLALTKFLLLTNQTVDLRNFRAVLTIILERFSPETDLFVFSNLSLDTLDYTGPSLNQGSRGVMLGIGEKQRDLPNIYQGQLPLTLRKAHPFSPGCLVVEGEFNETLFAYEGFKDWPLIILVDNIEQTIKSETAFLWTVFTRFEPAADLYAKKQVIRNHIAYSGPLLIDARMKKNYPDELSCDLETKNHVTKHWNTYFPNGMEMGDSETAHLN